MKIRRAREIMAKATDLKHWVKLVNAEQAKGHYHTGSWDNRR